MPFYGLTHGDQTRKPLIGSIPIPNLNASTTEILVNMVRTYIRYRREWLANPFEGDRIDDTCRQLLAEIDAVILRAYDLPPRLERQLLDCFQGYQRPGPVDFTEYYPPSFKPFIPWHRYISHEFRQAKIKETLARMPLIDDPAISEALSEL